MWCFDTSNILLRYTASIKFEISRLLPQLQQGRIKIDRKTKKHRDKT